MDKSMINATSKRALVDKTIEVARNLIADMVANPKLFAIRIYQPLKHVNEVHSTIITIDNQRLEQKLDELTFLVRKLVINHYQAIVVTTIGIYSQSTHPTNQCLTLQEDESIP